MAGARRFAALTAAAGRGFGANSGAHGGVIVVAYADAERTASLAPAALVDVAARTGARGGLLDTADKNGPSPRTLIPHVALVPWGALVPHERPVLAPPGQLTADERSFL